MELFGCQIGWTKALGSLAIFVASIVLAYVAAFVVKRVLEPLLMKTRTTLDERLVSALCGPLKWFFVLGGAYAAAMNACPTFTLYDKSLHELLFIGVILASAHAFSKLLKALIGWYTQEVLQEEKKVVVKELFPMGNKIVAIVVYGIALMIILDRLGVEIVPLLAGLGIAGLAVALALQDPLANFFAGGILLSEKPIHIGDRIALETEDSKVNGYVEEISWRTTKIRTPANLIYVIPNKKMNEATIVNFSLMREKKRSVTVELGVDYESDVNKVEKVLRECIEVLKKKEKDKMVQDFTPLVWLDDFGESKLKYKIIFQVKHYDDRWEIMPLLRKEILKQFRKNKIKIPFPVRTILHYEMESPKKSK